MREIVIKAGAPPELIRAVVVGPFKSGKTSLAATFPTPLFISDAVEGGYKTMYEMDPALWWDPAVRPEVWAIESFKDIGTVVLPRLEAAAQQGKFKWRTVVFDPISLYSDRVLSEMQQADPGKDNRQIYGDLGIHLRALIIRFQALPAHVLWLSHLKEGENGVELAIQGQTSGKLGAWGDFCWYTNVITAVNIPPRYELRTLPYRNVKFLGGRWKLPDPITPSAKAIFAALRMAETPVSPTLPGAPSAAPTAAANGTENGASTAAVAPPVVRRGAIAPPRRG